MNTSKWMLLLLLVLVLGGVAFVRRDSASEPPAPPQVPEAGGRALPAATVPVSTPPEAPPPTVETLPEDPADESRPAPGNFAMWIQQLRRDPAAADVALGLELAEARRERMASLIRTNPEQALAEALTPRIYAALPPDIQARVERPVAAEGFYGVLAICSHGEGEGHSSACKIQHEVVLGFGTFEAEVFPASIYGTRAEKLTVEQDSIYGVALDGHIALHESDVVIVDDGEGMLGGRYAVYYKGQAAYAETRENAEALGQLFLKQ